MIDGALVFHLKATHGLPLDFIIDRSASEGGIDWVGFAEEARLQGWWDFQTYDAIRYALQDAFLPKNEQQAVLNEFKRFVLSNPHPRMQ
jgi:cytochrome P450